MSMNYWKQELINKENIGVMANSRKGFGELKKNEIKDVPVHSQVIADKIIGHSPQIVSHYIDNILRHILIREVQEIKPLPEYMHGQRDINARMRAILVDWLVDVTLKFRMLPQTLFMTIALIDRYLAIKEVSRSKLQLVGVTALMIIGKYEEIYPPLVKDYVAVCDSAYTKQEILMMEGEMLLAFDFDLNKSCSLIFLEFFRQKVPMDDRAFCFCRYMLETALLDTIHLKFNNATLAAGSIFLVNKIFKKDAWPISLEIITGISESMAKGCAKELFGIMNRTDSSSLTGIKRKFADASFFEVSKYKIEKVPACPSI